MPNLAYNRDIPDGPNNPSTDQPNMKTNTNNTDTIIAVDHYSFNDNRGGTHKQVSLTNEAAPGIPALSSAVLFANLAADGFSWPFWQNAASGLLGFQIMGSNQPTAAGYAFLPGGLYIQWGPNGAVTGGSFGGGTANGTVTFPKVFPTACFMVIATPFWTTTPPSTTGAGTVTVDSAALLPGSFSWKFNTTSGAYKGFYWIAIGN